MKKKIIYAGAEDKGYVLLELGNEKQLKAQLLQYMDQYQWVLMHLQNRFTNILVMVLSNIYNDPRRNSSELNHSVVMVGYSTENGKDYWLVKNLWVKNWGIDGYIKMSQNNNNNCGIATQAIDPIV